MALQRILREKCLQKCRNQYSLSSGFATLSTSSSSSLEPPKIPEFDYQPKPYTGQLADEVFQKRKKYLGPSLFHYYQKPLNIVEGKMQYLFDETGRRYLDAFAGIVTVSCGHCHPDILNAVIEQSKLLQHATTIYLHHAIADFAEALASKMPGNLKVVYFVNSGTEANELATLMAKLYTGNHGMISLRNAYHGGSSNTIGLTALNTWKYSIPQGDIHHVINPDPYRGVFGSDAKAYARDVQDYIDYGTSGKIAGFIAETIQGVGGAVELAPGYLKLVYDMVRKAGGVCIADEVQTGFGRTGSKYWGFETQGVIPDIVTMAKGIGNGLPLGAVVTTPEIASVLAQKIQFNSYRGSPVCSAGGLAVLRVIDKEKRQQHCSDVGTRRHSPFAGHPPFNFGGGWCHDVNSCLERATTEIGSSNYVTENNFTGILSNNESLNPDFYNWNRVMLRYCDGASFAGNSLYENGTSSLYFIGQKIWQAIVSDLLPQGLAHAEKALLSGCSAGGLAVFLHCDNFSRSLPGNASVKCISDAGFFLDVKDVANTDTIRTLYHDVVSLQGVEQNLNQNCTSSQIDPKQCLFPQYFLSYIKTPMFILNTAYDTWQFYNILIPSSADPGGVWNSCKNSLTTCTDSQIQTLQDFRLDMLNVTNSFYKSSTSGGMFINSCFAHCQTVHQETWFAVNSPRMQNKAGCSARAVFLCSRVCLSLFLLCCWLVPCLSQGL